MPISIRSAARRLRDLVTRPGPAVQTLRSHALSVSRSEAAYLDVCRRAPIDAAVFSSFRRHPGYTRVLEHVTAGQGLQYLQALSPAGRACRHVVEAARNDTVGGPRTQRILDGLEISPTTLRYLKVADDLEQRFGTLDDARLVEIGVGYGGQCRILDSLFALKSYTLIDLRPVLGLAEEYLSHFPLRTAVRLITLNELAPEAHDLALSNYAFTELALDLQEAYFEKVLRRAPRGYMTYNDIGPAEYRSMAVHELAVRLGGASYPEVPLTHPRNRILIWGGDGVRS